MKLWIWHVALQHTACILTSIHVQNVDKVPKLPAFIMDELMQSYKIPESKQVLLLCDVVSLKHYSRVTPEIIFYKC